MDSFEHFCLLEGQAPLHIQHHHDEIMLKSKLCQPKGTSFDLWINSVCDAGLYSTSSFPLLSDSKISFATQDSTAVTPFFGFHMAAHEQDACYLMLIPGYEF